MPSLDKKITLYGLTMIAVGSCIGAGIFVTPYEVVRAIPHQGLVLLVWTLGGLIALTGALTFAELGGLFPKAGGVYVFLKESYGEFAAFLYGWVILLVINTGALAALSIAFAEYMTYFYPLTESDKVLLGIVVILSLTGLNVFGVNISQLFANTFTGLKLLAMLAIVVAGLVFYDDSNVQFQLLDPVVPDNLVAALLIGLIGVLWSFGGWHHASYLAGETIDPSRNVPRAMIFGTLIVTATYVLINLAYMLLLPLPDIANTTRVAGDAIGTIVPFGGKLVAIAIAISIFGTIGIYTMSAPRIYFAMAEDGIFFKFLTYIHPKYYTPAAAMLFQASWAVVLLVFWGTFEDLITYAVFVDILFMALAGASVFILRKSRPDAHRPYRTLGYPVIPLIFVGISSAFVLNTLLQKPWQAWTGLGVIGVGMLAYVVFRYLKHKKA